jgi:hypothetical protein
MFVISLSSFVIQQQIWSISGRYSWQSATYFEISEDDHPPLVTHARDHWWTLDFANAFVSPGVNSRAGLLPSPRAYARNGAPRR